MFIALVLFASVAFATSCVSSYECSEEWHECIDGECVFKKVACEANSDCWDHSCVDGYCDFTHKYCENTAGCEYWQDCLNHKCVLASGHCDVDSDCAVTNKCDLEHHRCAKPTVIPCTSSEDCESWEYCAALTPKQCLLKQGTCTNDSNCKEGEICQNHACIYPIGGPAAEPEETEGELQVAHNNATPCVQNSDCQDFEECNIVERICVLGAGSCYEDDNCGEWQSCTGNKCVNHAGMCSDQGDCNAENEICDEYHKCIPKPIEEPVTPTPVTPAEPAAPSEPAAPEEPEAPVKGGTSTIPVTTPTTDDNPLSLNHIAIFVGFVVLLIVVFYFLRGEDKHREAYEAKLAADKEEVSEPKAAPKKKTAKKKKRKTKKK